MERLRQHEQKKFLIAGQSLSSEDVKLIADSAFEDKCSVSDRFRLIGYCIKDTCSTETIGNVLFEQLHWLLKNLPDLELMPTVTAGYMFLDINQMFELYKTLLDVLKERQHSEEVLLNAVIFLRCCQRDKDLLNQLSEELQALRTPRITNKPAD